MRTIPIAAAAALAIMTVAASAQMTTSPTAPRPLTPGATQAPAPRPAVNPLTQAEVSNIDGTGVYGDDNEKLGHVSELLMDPQTKKIDRLVVTAGGVIGIGGHRVAIPIDQFKWDSDKGAFKLPNTMAQLKSLPEWVEGETTAVGSSTSPTTENPEAGK